MANITTALLDFLMGLLKNPEAAADFAANPDTTLQNAGLQGICAADVDAVVPVALDFSPIGNREYDTGGNSIDTASWGGGGGGGNGGGGWGGGGGHDGGHDGGGHHGGGHGGGHNDDHDYAAAKAKLLSVVNNYSYIDDRDVINDQSVNTTIWANDSVVGVDNEVENTATNVGDGSNVATTGGTVIAGNTEYDLDVDIEDSFNEETEVEIEDSFNDNSDNSTDNSTNVLVNDSFNTDNSTEVDIEDSFQDNSVEIEDSFQDNSTEVDIEDSFNETDTDVEVDIEDSFNEDNSVDNSTRPTWTSTSRTRSTRTTRRTPTWMSTSRTRSRRTTTWWTRRSSRTTRSIADNNVAVDSFDDNTVVEDNVVVNDSLNDNVVVEDSFDDNVEIEDSLNDNNLEQGGGDLTDVEVEVEDVTL